MSGGSSVTVDPAVAWHKLEAMVQGAELATADLS
jgi:hypothetical protein